MMLVYACLKAPQKNDFDTKAMAWS